VRKASKEDSMKFVDLGLCEPIVRAVTAESYETTTPIQAQAIPPALQGRDVLGCAQTGTGKTAAFALPILHRLSSTPVTGKRRPRCLVLAPTRELATQISDSFRTYGKHLSIRGVTIFGGVGQRPQVDTLRRGVEVIVATPGRLLDLMNQGHIELRGIETLVLDEADRMLDMGFIHDIRKIVAALPTERQTLFFSATMPGDIRKLAAALLREPVAIQIKSESVTVERVEQSVYFVDKRNKAALLAQLVKDTPMTRAIVFTRTKHGADRLVRHLHNSGIRSDAIHGNKTQNARQAALHKFQTARIGILIATDIASRGIDIDGITHVVNFDLTHEPETYVHRIGRTARAGAGGAAVSFCDADEMGNLKAIERLIRRDIPVCEDQPQWTMPMPVVTATRPARSTRSRAVQPRQGRKPGHRKGIRSRVGTFSSR